MDEFDEIREITEIFDIFHYAPPVTLFAERYDPFFDNSDYEFKQLCKFRKDEVLKLVELFYGTNPDKRDRRGRPIDKRIKIVAALTRYVKNEIQEVTCNQFGFSQSTMSRLNREFTASLTKVANKFIIFPQTAEEQRLVMAEFEKIAGIPKVLGAIGNFEVKIKTMGQEFPGVYVEKADHQNCYVTLRVQFICDAKCRITDVASRWTRSMNDQGILTESLVVQSFQNGRYDGSLIGDETYSGYPFVLTPKRNNNRFNSAHAETQFCIETVIDNWMSTFSGLSNCPAAAFLKFRASVNASAVLYNIAGSMRGHYVMTDSDASGSEESSSDGDESSG